MGKQQNGKGRLFLEPNADAQAPLPQFRLPDTGGQGRRVRWILREWKSAAPNGGIPENTNAPRARNPKAGRGRTDATKR